MDISMRDKVENMCLIYEDKGPRHQLLDAINKKDNNCNIGDYENKILQIGFQLSKRTI